jgi:alanyl-tRNA synthetase
MKNHTATHLLNLALRQVLGQHVEQKGSLVDDEKTRFDFTHDKPLTAEEIQRIEEKVNLQVLQDLPVTPTILPLAEAKKIPGVRAVFGEKYPDPVRVVMIGPDSPTSATPDDSVEFCGGTHLQRTGTIGLFKITSQEGVAKGVRRLTATTGRHAFLDAQKRSAILDELSGQLHCRPDELGQRVAALQDEIKKLQQQLKKGAASDLSGAVDKLLAEAGTIQDSKLIVGAIPPAGSDAIRAQVDRLRSKVGSCAVIFGWDDDGKVGLLAGVTDDLVKKGLHAGKLVGEAAKVVDGKGGGNPTLAQAGGKNPAKLPEALDRARSMAREILEK